MKTSSPSTGKRGLKFNPATARSNCLGVRLLILPGVLCSISLELPQLLERFEPAFTESLSSE